MTLGKLRISLVTILVKKLAYRGEVIRINKKWISKIQSGIWSIKVLRLFENRRLGLVRVVLMACLVLDGFPYRR
jgi:hypothetical protein